MRPDELEVKLQLLRKVLSERWTPHRLDEQSWGFQHVAGWVPLSCYAEINPQMEAFLFRAINPLPVEPDKRGLVAAYINLVNYPLPIGNWAINLEDGDVRWKSGVYFGRCDLSENLVRNVLESSLVFIYQHVVGIAKLQAGGTMEEAVASIGRDHGRGMTASMKQPG